MRGVPTALTVAFSLLCRPWGRCADCLGASEQVNIAERQLNVAAVSSASSTARKGPESVLRRG